jgi:hypothetical protein
MTIRNVTIATTLWLLIITIIAPYIVSPSVYGLSIYHGVKSTDYITLITNPTVMWGCLLLWLFTGSPLVVSLIIAVKVKHTVPSLVLLVSTIGYALWYILSWSIAMNAGHCMAGMSVIAIAPCSLVLMIPVWIATVSVNSSCVKQTISDPGTARSTAPSPAPLEP